MTKKQNTLYAIVGLFIGTVGGIAGTAYAVGADRQKVNDTISQHSRRINNIEKEGQKELDRLAQVIASQMSDLQSGIAEITKNMSELRTDVQVIKALMERMENDLKDLKNRA